ncbi:MAG: GNAT family N-acetyltransferase [Spirochaetales bacterium]|nr:GNAT family N-acetyltransferase [Spirochaetales bacterium]
MTLIRATESDFERLAEFYRRTVSETKGMELYARWIYGLHPTDEMIHGHIKCGNMFFSELDGKIASAVAAVPCQEMEYHDVPWNLNLADDEVSVVHILCVAPEVQKKGIAARTMRRLIEMSRESGKKAVRLDALKCNTPARRLYESLGFSQVAERGWHTENAGQADFVLYELEL